MPYLRSQRQVCSKDVHALQSTYLDLSGDIIKSLQMLILFFKALGYFAREMFLCELSAL